MPVRCQQFEAIFYHPPLNLPHPPRYPLCQFVKSLYELVRANVRKVDGNGSPLKNAVFGIYDSEEAAKKEDVALARLTTGTDGLSQKGEPENKKIYDGGGGEYIKISVLLRER